MPKTEAPNHDDMNTPTKKIKVMEVTNPKPIPTENTLVAVDRSKMNIQNVG